MKPVSAELHAALSAWLADATSGQPSGDCKSYGLCSYVRWHHLPAYEDLQRKIVASFGHKRSAYPFGSRSEYGDDCRYETQHLNRKRLAWVRRVLKAGIA